MALTSIIGNVTFKHVWGKFRAVLAEDVTQGALLSPSSSEDGWVEADQSDSEGAQAIALQAGSDGDTIWACLGAEVADGDEDSIAASGDVGSALYLAEDGDVSLSEGGTFAQTVGWVGSTYTLVLVPQVSLSGTSATISGNVSIGGTLGVTGNTTLSGTLAVTKATTLTGALAINGGATVASGKNLTLTKGTLTNTEGDIVATKGDITATEGDINVTAGHIIMTAGMIKPKVDDGVDGATALDSTSNIICCELTEDTTLTLPTASAGLWYEVYHKSGDKVLTIAPNTSDKIVDPADGGLHDKLYDDKGLDCHVKLVAVDDTNWICTSLNGDWTGAD